LLEKSRGKIINIAYMASLMQRPAMSNHNAAKAGVVACTAIRLGVLARPPPARHLLCRSSLKPNMIVSLARPTPPLYPPRRLHPARRR
ncbi:hypothetical protein B1218_34935, partial [Pseudomonas ogarae]